MINFFPLLFTEKRAKLSKAFRKQMKLPKRKKKKRRVEKKKKKRKMKKKRRM